MHTGTITTGKLYVLGEDGVERELGQVGNLEVDDVNSDYIDDCLWPKIDPSITGTFTLKTKFLQRRVWYRKRKGKHYIYIYRYEDVLIDQTKARKQFRKTLKKWRKKWRKKYRNISPLFAYYKYW